MVSPAPARSWSAAHVFKTIGGTAGKAGGADEGVTADTPIAETMGALPRQEHPPVNR